jgi:type VI protein secretion system component Hcp
MADAQKYFFLNMIAAGVPGASQKAGHVGWLELDSWDFSMNQTADPNIGGGRPTKTAASGRFGFSIKHNGPSMFKLGAMGQYIGSAITFEAERSGLAGAATGAAAGTANLVYLQLVFTKSAISHRGLSGDEGQKQEHIELVFETVAMTYKPVVKGAPGPAVTKSYDAKSNKVV